MADLPIIFSGPMVRALLDGRKTMTRRILSPSNLRIWTGGLDHGGRYVMPDRALMGAALNNARGFRMIEGRLAWRTDPAPHQAEAVFAQWIGKLTYAIGDRLYVRENWALHDKAADVCTVAYAATIDRSWTETINQFPAELAKDMPARPYQEAWRPSIHLPRWASRLTLVVTATKVEKLQDISSSDTEAEGIYFDKIGYTAGPIGIGKIGQEWSARDTIAFANLWRALHGIEAWDANPEVVALTFTVHQVNIDQLAKAMP